MPSRRSVDGAISSKIDTSTGTLTGAGWPTAFPNLTGQGGLSGFSELCGNLAALSQGWK